MNKLTDAEIVKALECCANEDLDCEDCPAHKYCDEDTFGMVQYVLDLIKRKDVEIEQWKEEANKYQSLWCEAVNDIQTAKSEAIKEFIEKFKAYIPSIDGDTTMDCVERAIKQAKKEMMGE